MGAGRAVTSASGARVAISRWALALLSIVFLPRALAAQSDSGWRVVADPPAGAGSPMEFARMPPGWHATASSTALACNPANTWAGADSLESVVYLFSAEPGTGAGLFIGGRALGTAEAHYVAFVVGPDGRYRITRRKAGVTTDLVPWRASTAIPRHPGGQGNVRLVLAIHADSTDVVFAVNDTVVATLPRVAADPAGVVGFRAERGTSAHIATLEIGGRNVAPVPPGAT